MAPAIKPVVPHVPGTYRLLYFDAPNRGEQVRLLLSIAGVKWNDVRLSPYPQGLDPYKSAALGELSPLCGTDLVPAVTTPDGTNYVETADIMRIIGQQVGLAPPAGSAGDTTAKEMCLLAQSVINKVFYGLLMRMVVKHIFAIEFCGILKDLVPRLVFGSERAAVAGPLETLTHVLTTTEECLVRSGGPFVLGAQMCFADVSLFDALEKALMYDCFDKAELLAVHPKVASMLVHVEQKAQPWLETRARQHMAGQSTIAGFLAVTNTPFFWSRVPYPHKQKAKSTGGDMYEKANLLI